MARIIYFVLNKDNGLIKIGITWNIKSRLTNLKCECKSKNLALLGIMHDIREKTVHDMFTAHRVWGEWFLDCDEIRHFIYRNCYMPDMGRTRASK